MYHVTKILLSIFFIFITLSGISQHSSQASNWYFGWNSGITFNTTNGHPQPLYDGQIHQNEGCASISDSNGELLFYTDGMTIWDKDHNPMPNGQDLLGDPSASMSSLIVPAPSNLNQYYIFTVPRWNSATGLNYSIIDMELNEGLGDVTDQKNIYLAGPVHEMVTSVRHSDGESFWIVSHLWETNSFVSFLIDTDSLHTVPDTSNIGLVHHGDPMSITGYMKLSPQGDKLAICVCPTEEVQLFDFNNENAQLSNPITLPPYGFNDTYGIEFSPDGNKIYISSSDRDINQNAKIFQYDLSTEDSALIVSSGTEIMSLNYYRAAGAVQLGQDNRVYIANSYCNYLSAINYPDKTGADCEYIAEAIYLENGNGTHLSRLGLPAFIQSFFNPANFTWEGHCIGDTTFFAITDTASQDSVFWDFGDPASGVANYSDSFFSYHVFEDTGAYQVSVIGYNNNLNDTTVQEILVHPLPVLLLPADTGFCEAYGVNLWPGSFQSYLWQNGSTDSSFYADTTQSVIVEVTDVQGCKNSDTTQAVEHSKPDPLLIFHD